jgi:hypothetical protein
MRGIPLRYADDAQLTWRNYSSFQVYSDHIRSSDRRIVLTDHDMVSHNSGVTFFAAPEVRGAHSSRALGGSSAGALRVAALSAAAFLTGVFLSSTSGYCENDAPRPLAGEPSVRLTDTSGTAKFMHQRSSEGNQ